MNATQKLEITYGAWFQSHTHVQPIRSLELAIKQTFRTCTFRDMSAVYATFALANEKCVRARARTVPNKLPLDWRSRRTHTVVARPRCFAGCWLRANRSGVRAHVKLVNSVCVLFLLLGCSCCWVRVSLAKCVYGSPRVLSFTSSMLGGEEGWGVRHARPEPTRTSSVLQIWGTCADLRL